MTRHELACMLSRERPIPSRTCALILDISVQMIGTTPIMLHSRQSASERASAPQTAPERPGEAQKAPQRPRAH